MAQAQAAPVSSFTLMKIIHIVIGISIMLLLPNVGSPEFVVSHADKLVELGFPEVDGGVKVYLSDIGMQVICIFLGLIYLWTVVDTVWPGFLAIFLLAISDFGNMNQVLNMYFGNPTIVFMFFVFFFAAVLVKSQISVYLARYLMTRDFVAGKPWILTTMLLVTTYIVALIDQVSAVFIMWPVMYSLFKECGYKKGDGYVSAMICGVIFMAVLMFATDAIKGGAFLVIVVANQIGSNPAFNLPVINVASYMAFAFAISIVCIAAYIFLLRFVFRVNVEPIKNFDINVLKENPLPPMTWKQKTTIGLFIFLALWLLGGGVLPATNPVKQFLSANQMGLGIVLLFIMTVIEYKGEKFVTLNEMTATAAWNVFFLIAAAMLFGNALSTPATNFNVVVEYVLRDLFSGFSFFTLIVASVLLAISLTNFTNSVVTGIIFAPILIPLCMSYGYNPLPVLVCFFYTVLIALCTPAASPYAALLFGNTDWVEPSEILKYTLTASLIAVLSVLCVGVPLAMILF